MRQTLKMEQEFSQNGTGPFWSTLWLRFGWIPGLSSSRGCRRYQIGGCVANFVSGKFFKGSQVDCFVV